MNWLDFLIGFAAALLSSLGLGGGTVLLIYLISFGGLAQLEGQGTNLIFFLIIAVFPIGIYIKKKLIAWKTVLTSICCGVLGVATGFVCSDFFQQEWLSKAFAVLLLWIGLKEVFPSQGSKNIAKNDKV